MMKKFLLAAMMLVPAVAQAQMGPAGPPGGQVVQSNGSLLVYKGQQLGYITAAGKDLNVVYVPSPTYNGPQIYSVHYYTTTSDVETYGAWPISHYGSGTNKIFSSPDGAYTLISADAYDFFGNIVDSCINSVPLLWTFPATVSLDSSPTGSVNLAMSFVSTPAELTIRDLSGDDMGPNSRWRAEIEYSWDSNCVQQGEYDGPGSWQYGNKRNINPSMSWATYFRLTSGQTVDDGKIIDSLSLRVRFWLKKPDGTDLANPTGWTYRTFKLKRQSQDHWILIPAPAE